ncbi:hypothetical protein Lepto7375DRAFT_0549 [Leptolyngbya sp. PCC 7375]|nr:hypothetical protein Lepto7375DRAFT_0549 [Leptolyngbya sp. PCC 7375]
MEKVTRRVVDVPSFGIIGGEVCQVSDLSTDERSHAIATFSKSAAPLGLDIDLTYSQELFTKVDSRGWLFRAPGAMPVLFERVRVRNFVRWVCHQHKSDSCDRSPVSHCYRGYNRQQWYRWVMKLGEATGANSRDDRWTDIQAGLMLGATFTNLGMFPSKARPYLPVIGAMALTEFRDLVNAMPVRSGKIRQLQHQHKAS